MLRDSFSESGILCEGHNEIRRSSRGRETHCPVSHSSGVGHCSSYKVMAGNMHLKAAGMERHGWRNPEN